MSFDKIIYRLTDKRIPAATGIGLVGDILDRAGFQGQFRNVRSENKRSRKQIDWSDQRINVPASRSTAVLS